MKKFKELKRLPRPKKTKKVGYWTEEKLKLLADNYYLLSDADLRRLFDGYSISTISNKAMQLRKGLWKFAPPKLPVSHNVLYLYKLTNLDTKKSYIGVTYYPEQRLQDHENGGWVMEILDAGPSNRIALLEGQAILDHKTLHPHGYNKVQEPLFKRTTTENSS